MMEKKIYKYLLRTIDEQTILFHGEPEILSAQFQGGELCLWAIVDRDAALIAKVIEVHGTGNPFPINGDRKFIATAQDGRTPFVWHIFERLNAPTSQPPPLGDKI